MSYKRSILPIEFKSGSELDNDLNAIGINIACNKPTQDPNIEDTLVAASMEGVSKNDGRLLSLLIDWLEVHYERINVSRLTDIVVLLNETQHRFVKIFWCANAQRFTTDIRFKHLASIIKKDRIDFIDRNVEKNSYQSTPFLIQKNGEDERFKNTCIRVPNKVYPTRLRQIATPSELSRRHMGYRYRVMFGPSYRADVWAVLRRYPELSPTEIAKKTYCSYASAFETKQDYLIVKRDYKERDKVA